MDRFDPFAKYADVYGDIINWEKDPMNKPQNQNKYFFSDGKTYYEQICKMLRLMSVFKEAFNQIYSNEDEISEAWENFVNNLSASVVEGSEPDVTLTWTDDSVNFEFTMVPGAQGEQGVGITSISFNSDYTMTITLSDGNTYTSMSLKGETGSGLQILDVYATLADLQSAHPTGQPGDAYQVGSAGNYILYIWSSSQSTWVPAGSLGTLSPSVSNPLMDGTAAAGSLDQYSRGDHVHPTDTSRASKEELDALIKTSQSLIDQSFTYRESRAIQDGLARLDKIKGNTLVWNQLVQNGNFADTTVWDINANGTLSVSNNEGVVTLSNVPSNSYSPNIRQQISIDYKQGHKYLFTADVYLPHNSYFRIEYGGGGFGETSPSIITANTWTTVSFIMQKTSTITSRFISFYPPYASGVWSANDVWKIRNVNVFDLTQMFGSGNEPSTVEEFTALFPLPYYQYNAGELLSFNGTGIKVTNADSSVEETLSLPIAQYFPNGMDGVGSSYDELTNTKATTRMARVDLGTLNWNYRDAYNGFFYSNDISDVVALSNEIACSKYDKLEPINATTISNSNKVICVNKSSGATGLKNIILIDRDYTDPNLLKQSLSEVYLVYPLETPTEVDVDLDLSYITYEGGTEQLLPVNGSVPSTTPIIADMTYMSLDDAMEYVLEKLANVPQNTTRIGTLETDLASTDGQVQNLATSVSGLDSTVTAQGETVTALDNFVSNIANTRNPGYMSSDNSIGITSAFLNMTLAAGQSTWADIPLPTIMAGFIPLFIVGAATGDGRVCLFKIPSTYNQNNIYRVGVKNTSNSEVTTQVSIEILCIKQRQSQ